MINELRELVSMVEKMPNMVMYVLAGYGIYKLVMYLAGTGAIVMLVKLAITKAYDAYTHKKSVPQEYDLSGTIINKAAMSRLMTLLDDLRLHDRAFTTNYIHESDVQKLADAWHKYKNEKK